MDALTQVQEINDGRAKDFCGSLLVIDNDPDASASKVVLDLRHPLIRYAVEKTPGIPWARNRAIIECETSDLLIFIDDDERPQPGWLYSLLKTWKATQGAAVMGRVVSEFTADLSPWVSAGDFFWRKSMPTGTEIPVAATGNLLLDLNQVRQWGLLFDTSLGLGGGEDTLFSHELTRAGGRIVWCDESIAIDVVPPERCTVRWVLARSWSHGNNDAIIRLRLAQRPFDRVVVRLQILVGGLTRCTAGFFRFLVGFVSRSLRHQARGMRTAWRGAGMAAGACGLRYQEYARD